MMGRPTPSSLQRQVKLAIDVLYDGNVQKAALHAGLPSSTISRMIEGTVEAPRLTTLKQLAQSFGVSLAWLIGEASDATEFDGHEVWFGLLTSYFRARQRPLRDQLARAKSAKEKDLAAAFSRIKWTQEPESAPMPITLLLADTPQGGDDRMQLLRNIGEWETALLEAAVRRIKS